MTTTADRRWRAKYITGLLGGLLGLALAVGCTQAGYPQTNTDDEEYVDEGKYAPYDDGTSQPDQGQLSPPNCSAYHGRCDLCLASAGCGFCGSTGNCAPGSAGGPENANYCPAGNWIGNGTSCQYATPLPYDAGTRAPDPDSSLGRSCQPGGYQPGTCLDRTRSSCSGETRWVEGYCTGANISCCARPAQTTDLGSLGRACRPNGYQQGTCQASIIPVLTGMDCLWTPGAKWVQGYCTGDNIVCCAVPIGGGTTTTGGTRCSPPGYNTGTCRNPGRTVRTGEVCPYQSGAKWVTGYCPGGNDNICCAVPR